MKLKVCGMKEPDNIREVAKLSPDMMGFIFYPGSKRYVGEAFVMPEIPSEIKKVGVFVNDTIENIFGKAKKYKLDAIQLHGDESAEFCSDLFQSFKLWKSYKIIKAFGIDEQFDFSVLNDYENYCNYFLFDTKTKEYGGSGKAFDWSILKHYQGEKKFFLSGGIGLGAVSILNSQYTIPFALDVNSKFETEPGIKDIHKLKKLKDELSGKR